jgi:hypothetical protein
MTAHHTYSKIDNLSSKLPSARNDAAALRMLLQGSVGAFIGVVIAIALARGLFPPDGGPASAPGGLLSWILGSVRLEPREKGFYLLSLLLGPAGAFLGSCRYFRGATPTVAVVLLLTAAIPLGNAYARFSLQGDLPAWFGLGLGLLLAGLYFGALRYGTEIKLEKAVATNDGPHNPLLIYISIIAGLAFIIFPSSFQAVAARIGMEMHVVSFLVGPSLYFLGHGLLPGVDYYAQYGLGLGWVFSFFIAKTVEETMINYVVLIVVAVWLFFAHLVWILRWLYQSWLAAAVVSLLALILLFHTDRHFSDPSSFVLRYPMLTICAALLARWLAAPRSWTWLLSLAVAISVSLFIETETGVIMAVSVSLSFLLVSPWRFSSLILMAKLGTLSLVSFVVLLLLVFGPSALTIPFVTGLIEPLTIYGVAGLGGWPIAWTLREWNWLYNLVAPGVALATIGVMPRIAGSEQIDRPRAGLIVFFAACGLLMAAKFINMSIVAVWQMNALGFLVVLGWWATSIARLMPRQLDLARQAIPVRTIAVALMIVLAVALAGTSSDQRNPALYGLRSWATYPSLLMRPFRHLDGCIKMDCVANKPDQRDVALIRARTRPGEQVAIVGDLFDWTYLIDAHRPPMLAFLPSLVVFTQHQLDESWKRMASADYWFIPTNPNGTLKIDNADLSALVIPALNRDFVPDGVGDRLTAWKRKR